MRVLLLLNVLVLSAFAQVPIPKQPLGFTYGNGDASAQIQLEAFMGPLCPDSKECFATLQNVASFYGPSRLRLRYHLFPLPYHRNAFIAAKATRIVDRFTNSNETIDFMGTIYTNIDSFSNDATHGMSEAEVIQKLADYGSKMAKVSMKEFVDMMSSDTIEGDTRTEWKYTCSRGFSGTPTFTVNDVLVAADPKWTVSEWRQVLDPLLGITSNSIPRTFVRGECKIGTKRCEYLPGKVECCTKGEGCIPNVGCRC
uniref:Thioredoxin-like fold domain-containing protein n=1 Tax=Pinctada fucata TaxID=50426 RepID=A0A194ANN1_PINFU